MNFFGSHAFLDAAASIYFKDRHAVGQNVRIGDHVLRLLVVDDKKVVTRMLFLDYHQSLTGDEIDGPVRGGRYAERVSQSVVEIGNWLGNDEESLAPFVDWTQFSRFEDYRDLLLARYRGLIRDRERRARALEAQYGRLVLTVDDHADDVLASARQWKGRQLREIGLPDYFEDERAMAFLRLLRDRGELVCSTLRAGGQLVSLWIGFIHQGSWSGWIFTYDPAFKKYSAGHQLLIRMLETSFQLGHKEFDFSIGAQEYKLQYATHGRVLGDAGTPSFGIAAKQTAKGLLRGLGPQFFATALRTKSALGSVVRRTPVLSMMAG